MIHIDDADCYQKICQIDAKFSEIEMRHYEKVRAGEVELSRFSFEGARAEWKQAGKAEINGSLGRYRFHIKTSGELIFEEYPAVIPITAEEIQQAHDVGFRSSCF